MAATSISSVRAGSCTDDLRRDGASSVSMMVRSRRCIQLANDAVLGLIEKITVLEENTFRLQSARMMQSIDNRHKNAFYGSE